MMFPVRAVKYAVVVVVTGEDETAKFALVAPAGTTMSAGPFTLALESSSVVTRTIIPPCGGGPLMRTVPVVDPGPTSAELANSYAVTTGAFTTRVANRLNTGSPTLN